MPASTRPVPDLDAEVERLPYEEIGATAFGTSVGGGNPALVVLGGARISLAAMQGAAERTGLETGVVLPPEGAADLQLRFFVAGSEMSMCVHGTIGAVAVLAGRIPDLPRTLRIETRSGLVTVRWTRGKRGVERGVEVTVSQAAPEFKSPLTTSSSLNPLLAALRMTSDELDLEVGPVQSVSVSRAKLLVPVRDHRALDSLTPDYERLWAVCDGVGVTGVYAFTRSPRSRDRDIDARQFPLRAGFVEDPATGVAAAALAGYLCRSALTGANDKPHVGRYRIGQGDAMGCPCKLYASAFVDGGSIIATGVRGHGEVSTGRSLPRLP
ncbi:MAG: PhzF family phenazine biosynthesis isomerase [Gemmatimonadota bacterium]|nr:PhzF family phenazine biosynthesis isomerase [Gemmatimonadota bacterium]